VQGFQENKILCDVINGQLSATCGPWEILISFLGNLHFFKK